MRNIHIDSSSLVTNLIKVPQPTLIGGYWFRSSATVATLVDTIGYDGTPAVRSVRKTTAAYALYQDRDDPFATAVSGDRYTVFFNIMSNIDMSINMSVGVGTGTATLPGVVTVITLMANVGQEIRTSFTVPASGFSSFNMFMKLAWGAGSGAIDDWFEISKVLVVKGNYPGAYFDGGSQNAKWNGTTNYSTSTGYARI